MKLKSRVVALIAASALGASGYGLYHLGINKGKDMVGNNAVAAGPDPGAAMAAGHVDPASGKKVLYWHDPMVPGQKFDKPGKSPFMDMQLVPVYADGGGDEGKVSISPRVQQNLGVRTAEVTRGAMISTIEAVGSVAYNERDVAVVQARANRRPDWSVQLMYSQRGSTFSNMVSLNVSVPVPWDRARRQDRELAAKLATVEQMRAEREDASRAHVAEALAMLQEWHSDRDRLSRYDASLLPFAEERKQAALAAYRGASGTLSAVLDARRNEIDTRIDRLLLEMQTARLWAQLNYLIPVGHDLPTHGE